MIKTFYLGNAKHTDVRTAVQGLLGTAGGGRQIASLDQVNALIVRATPSELQMIQEVINSLDKNLAEVVIDVNIYEVSNTAALEIGNQIAVNSQPVTRTERDSTGRPIDVTQGYTPSLTNLGGIAVKGLTNVLGFTYSPFLGGIGTTLGLPPSALSLLQSRGNSKLLYSGQIHALDGQQNQTKVGRSVPVRTGTNYGYGAPQITTGTPGQQGGTTAGIGGFNSGLFDNIQYKDVGLVIDVTPKVSNEGYVEIKMKLETSDVQQSGESTNLTPTFTQRTLATTSRIQDGVTSVVAGVKINSSGESRAGLAFIGMLPLLGRLFTVPKRSSSEGDIIITVTPHITRAPRINKEDHYAQLSGPMQGGIPRSIEDVVNRIKADEEEERRLIAMQQGLPAATAPVSASATPTIPVSNPAPAPGTPVIQNVGNNPQPFVSDPVRVNTAAPSAPGAIVPAAEQPPSETPPVAEKADEDEPKLTDEEKKALEEINKSLARPTQPVTQARIVGAEWPENVRRAAEEARAEALKRAKEAKPELEVTVPPEVIAAHQPKQQVRRASINSGARPAVSATSNEPPPPAAPGQPTARNDSKKAVAEIPVNLTLAPLSVNPVVGKTFLLNLNASAETAASSARIALNFDPKKLQLKSVRPGAMLGSNPDLIHQVSGGELLLTIKSSGQKGGASNGTLAVIEFSVLSSGETIISIDDAGSQITLVGDIPARLSTVASQIKLQQQ
jgi:Flp pilus assembly secretin CpaC